METRENGKGDMEYLCDDCRNWVRVAYVVKEDKKIKQKCQKCFYKK